MRLRYLLQNMTIRTRLLAMVIFMSLLLIGIGLLGMLGMKAANEGLNTVYENRVVPLKDLKIIADMYAVNIVDTSHRVRNGYMFWADGLKNIDEAKKTISERWNSYLETFHVEEEKKIVAEIKLLMKKTDASIDDLRDIMKKEEIADLHEYISSEIYPAIDPVSKKINELVNVQLTAARDVYRQAEARYKAYRAVATGGILGGILLGVFVALWIIRNITRSLSDLTEKIGRISNGDLTVTIESDSKDEIGELARNLNGMTSNLRNLIREIKYVFVRLEKVGLDISDKTNILFKNARIQQSAVESTASAIEQMNASLKSVSESSDVLSSASDDAASTIAEMAASINEVARNMEAVASSVDETASSTEEMYASIQSISGNIEVLARASEDTMHSVSEINASLKEIESLGVSSARIAEKVERDASEAGITSVEKTIEGMGQIKELAEKSSDVIRMLDKKSKKIDSILTVIDDVTEQTKLLSLNAAIIAAQAGDYGKGFGVVADEIKVLAEETDSRTKEITDVISGIQKETVTAVESIDSALGSVKHGLELSQKSGDALQQILKSSVLSADMAKKIEKATAAQAEGIKQITKAVTNISEMIEMFVESVSEQRKGMANIAKEAESMKDITREVKSSVIEQASGSRQMKETIEKFSEKMNMIASAVEEIRIGSDQVLKSVENIKTVANENTFSSENIKSSLDNLTEQADQLKSRIEVFVV